MSLFCVLPPYMLQHLAQHGSDQQQSFARATLALDTRVRQQRNVVASQPPATADVGKPGHVLRAIFDCKHGTSLNPTTPARKDGGKPSADQSVDEAYDGLGDTYALYWDVYNRNSVDDKGLELKGFVHYDRSYDNAFWNGSEMIFGDGDGVSFNRFTSSVDVIGHELTHGVTQYEANLDYNGQSGALNESVSDCFGSLVKQYALKQSAKQADWLIGAGLLTDKHDKALRSLKEPGTAYDDPELGKDPQPAHMSDYVDTEDDDGGVHINSGIPNRAFYLASIGIGGNAWDGAGKIWYQTLTSKSLKSTADFASFAQATVASAQAIYGKTAQEVEAVSGAWKTVGVE